MRIIISRTDSIGDVVLTLPMAGVLKQTLPGCTIIFLGTSYTRPVVELCRHVDEFAEWPPPKPSPPGDIPPPQPSPKKGREFDGPRLLAELNAQVIIHVFPVKEICQAAKRAGIPVRIATARRFFTWVTCNRLLHIPRKNSNLHEVQLNLKMLKGLGIDKTFALDEIAGLYGLAGSPYVLRPTSHVNKRYKLILHPKSKGSAREWGLDNFSTLIALLPEEEFEIFITGTKEDGKLLSGFLEMHRDRVTDLTGKLTLPEFISLIASSDGLVAASTGPLHLAAALGIRAVGLYAPMRPIFPTRWAPIGKNATFLVLDKTCSDCRRTKDCHCIRGIRPESVCEALVGNRES